MKRSDLIQKLYLKDSLELSLEDATAAVNHIIGRMTDALGRGERIEIRGFGAFSLNHRETRMGHNPMTGESVRVPERYVARFKPGKLLRERVNAKFLEGSS